MVIRNKEPMMNEFSEEFVVAVHEVGHAVARLELGRLDPSIGETESFDGVAIESTEAPSGRVYFSGIAHIPARMSHLDIIEGTAEICRFRAHKMRDKNRRIRAGFDRIVEADALELLAGPIAEECGRVGRPLGDQEIADFVDGPADYRGESFEWCDIPDDMSLVHRRVCWLVHRRRRDPDAVAERLVRRTIDLLGVGTDHGLQKIVSMAAILVTRRSVDADAFVAAWDEIRGKGPA